MLDGNLPYIKNSELIVEKFGAGVLKNGGNLKDILSAVSYDGKSVYVVSALEGVTDKLNEYHSTHDPDLLRKILGSYLWAGRKNISKNQDRQEFKKGINECKRILERSRDKELIKSTGEILSTGLVYFIEKSKGKDVGIVRYDRNFPIVCSDTRGNADPILEKINLGILRNELDEHSEVIFPGFIGMTEEGETRTLGKGGSDTTATVLSTSLSTGLYDVQLLLWKEPEGILAADPKIVEDPKHISNLTYLEADNITKFGGKVVQHKAIKIAENCGIEPVVTCISNPKIYTKIGGVDKKKDLVKYVGGTDKAIRIVDTFERIIELRNLCVSYNSQDDFHMLWGDSYGLQAMLLDGEFLGEGYKDIERIGVVALVGDEMKKKEGILTKASNELSKGGINVDDVASGGKEKSFLILFVKSEDVPKSIIREYNAFIK